MNDIDQLHTDFLFTTPNYLTGAATVFNLAGNFYEFNKSDPGDDADEIAVENDFKIVGQDLARSIGSF